MMYTILYVLWILLRMGSFYAAYVFVGPAAGLTLMFGYIMIELGNIENTADKNQESIERMESIWKSMSTLRKHI